ncbi:MAG TPA: hypothetical protein VHF45_04385, partial [Thermoleophilaceae bacterium]|nr:hypothetical protein [Thermoleophilaceae bacterium]
MGTSAPVSGSVDVEPELVPSEVESEVVPPAPGVEPLVPELDPLGELDPPSPPRSASEAASPPVVAP